MMSKSKDSFQTLYELGWRKAREDKQFYLLLKGLNDLRDNYPSQANLVFKKNCY